MKVRFRLSPPSLKLLPTVLLLFIWGFAGRLVMAQTNRVASPAPRAPDLKVADRFLLAIPRTGFGKDYLFTASLIPQAQAATSSGLAGKIVRFELFPDGVDMYESTQGLVVTEDLPARRPSAA